MWLQNFLVLLAGCAFVALAQRDASASLRNVLSSANFTRLVDELTKFELVDDIGKLGPKTILAPSNEAFRMMMMNNRLAMNNTELMKKLLRRGFVINRRILPSEITNEMVVESASGEKLRFNIYGDNKTYTVNGAIMQREPLVLNDAVVIYRLNNVIESTFGDGRRMIDMLQANKDRFSTLIAAIQAAGLTDTLQKEPGPFTLFAPTNEAFKSLPPDALARLNASPEEMKKVLLGHVSRGTFFLGALDTNTNLATLDGGKNRISITGNIMKVDSTPVVTSADNIMAENGVIHAISRVLMP